MFEFILIFWARFFQLDPARTTVLAVGGSLGAKSINEALRKDLDRFGASGLQLIWQTGKPFEAEGSKAAEGKGNVWCGPFITQMEQAYAAADLVISRAGAMAIAELCITGKPAVLVPFPFAAEDHQTHNARQLADQGAGIMVADAEAMDKLVPQVIDAHITSRFLFYFVLWLASFVLLLGLNWGRQPEILSAVTTSPGDPSTAPPGPSDGLCWGGGGRTRPKPGPATADTGRGCCGPMCRLRRL